MTSTSHIDPGTAAAIRLLTLDVDGVLTDGGIGLAVGPAGTPRFESRQFHAQDGLAITMLRQAGIEVAIVSGNEPEAVRWRARQLGIEHVRLGVPRSKHEAVAVFLAELGLEWPELAHMGDDLTDLPVHRRAGLAAAPANAVPEVQATADWVGQVAGGAGAVREFARALLMARGEWEELVTRWARGDE